MRQTQMLILSEVDEGANDNTLRQSIKPQPGRHRSLNYKRRRHRHHHHRHQHRGGSRSYPGGLAPPAYDRVTRAESASMMGEGSTGDAGMGRQRHTTDISV